MIARGYINKRVKVSQQCIDSNYDQKRINLQKGEVSQQFNQSTL